MTPPIRMVSVPVEPTELMMNACPSSFSPSFAAIWPKVCRDIYQAMITAAPMREEGGAVDRLTEIAYRDEASAVMVQANDLRAILSAFATREEAQPVAWEVRFYDIDGRPGEWKPCDPPSTNCLEGMARVVEYRQTTPPAPEAEKLRVTVEALEAIKGLSVSLRQGGPDTDDLHDLSDSLENAVDWAVQALAALQQEGRDRG